MSVRLWNHDRQFPRHGVGLVGVDEAGRGCLAGPVFAGAVYLPETVFERTWGSWKSPKINDSKQLSKAERERAFSYLHNLHDEGTVRIGIGLASVEEIEVHNILGATTLAMGRAMEALNIRLERAEMPLWNRKEANPFPPVLIDGRPVKRLPYSHQGLVQGDGKSLAIALASVLAKVERDRFMAEAHEENPQYGWDRNCGYGTDHHRRAIQDSGPCSLHRSLFLRNVLRKIPDGLSS